MEERRLYRRFAVDDLDVQTATISSTVVEIRDISPVGVSIVCSKKLNIGAEYTIKFGSRERFFSARGVVKWEKLIGSRKKSEKEVEPLYLAGLEFAEVLTAKAAPIMEFITKHLDFGDRRIKGIRFSIFSGETAVLNNLETYVVRIISLGGMLIEAKQEFSPGSVFPMELHLPENESPLSFSGRIAHCNAVQKGDAVRYHVGIEFIEMTEQDRLRLRDFTTLVKTA
jgi:Tfp pilus assembly protein PilZ